MFFFAVLEFQVLKWLRTLFHFESIFVQVRESDLVSSFYIEISSLPGIVCWSTRACVCAHTNLYQICCSWLCSFISASSVLLYLQVFVSTQDTKFFLFSFFTFLLLQLYNLLWNKVLQYFQHCFFPLRIALASWGSFVLLYEILDFFFLVLWRMWLGFDGECIESVSCFLIKLCSAVDSAIPWAWEVKKNL